MWWVGKFQQGRVSTSDEQRGAANADNDGIQCLPHRCGDRLDLCGLFSTMLDVFGSGSTEENTRGLPAFGVIIRDLHLLPYRTNGRMFEPQTAGLQQYRIEPMIHQPQVRDSDP
ncbi:hypothetical protein TNCV_2770451 [Trichonephila clavipes]|nr:hypothetical protein TNCV_2770451 [Trichonephila clavipes]